MKLLQQLISYCETLPNDYKQFDMRSCMHTTSNYPKLDECRLNPEMVNDCSTIACFVGHGLKAGIKPLTHERWCEYSERISKDHAGGDTWNYLFSDMWADYEPTLKEAIKRGKKVLAGFGPTESDLPWED